MHARFAALALLLLATLLVAGCGDDDTASDGSGDDRAATTSTSETDGASTDGASTDDGPTADGTVLQLGAVDNKLEFDKTELTAPAGTVTLELTNDSSIPHNVALKQGDEEIGEPGELVTGGDVSRVTVDLEPGTYTYVCSPHESAGMVGTLTVT